jgi:hypothetical protein
MDETWENHRSYLGKRRQWLDGRLRDAAIAALNRVDRLEAALREAAKQICHCCAEGILLKIVEGESFHLEDEGIGEMELIVDDISELDFLIERYGLKGTQSNE